MTNGPHSRPGAWWKWPLLGALLWCIGWSWATIGFHQDIPDDDWTSEIRADAAGYYIYLPGTFHHGMRAAALPDTLVVRTGEGFVLHRDRDRIITKYTYVTALLIAPFYFVAEVITGFQSTDGLSPMHYHMLDVAGIIYWTLGLLLLWAAMRALFPAAGWRIPVLLVLLSFGTNLFYYAFRAPGFAHVYGFFLTSLALWAIATGVLPGKGGRRPVLFQLACALILVQRPLDAILVAGLYAWPLVRRPALLRSLQWWTTQVLIFAVVLLPQLIYYKWAHGSWLVDSYENEGFVNWRDPQFGIVLFSPLNGLVWYAPLFLGLIPGVVALGRTDRSLALIMALVFIGYVYACASWHSPHFGCSFGQRSLVGFIPLLAIAWCAWLKQWPDDHSGKRYMVALFMVEGAWLNACAALEYPLCYFGKYWEWEPLFERLLMIVRT